ncbi:MAG: thiE [Gammaproteobacteria bacterium]|nr:thiE [Gammaproteobacteria bacterium]
MSDRLPIVWTIAGSDSGGGAGIQADLHTFHALGVHGCSAITAITAQNTMAVEHVLCLPAENIRQQIQALAHDLPPQAIKIGMIGDSDNVAEIRSFLADYKGPVVLDPVIVAGSGDPLLLSKEDEYCDILASIYPFIEVLTANIPEAEALSGKPIYTHEDIKIAADILLSKGVKNVLIKGGHFQHDPFSQDYWTDGSAHFWLSSKREHFSLRASLRRACDEATQEKLSQAIQEKLNHSVYHGTGCTLSSAIAAFLARGITLKEALVMAKMYVTQNVVDAKAYGSGSLLLPHAVVLEKQAYLPYLSQHPLQDTPTAFPVCGYDLGLYPVVETAQWLSILLPLGIKTIQLRVKDKIGEALENEIQQAVTIAKKYQARLFINDYWDLAIKYGAYGVHLGQEDLLTADLQQIKNAGLRLGLSTHSYEELATAHAHRPSYIAFGPIFSTTSKQMPFDPQGIEKLKQIRQLVDYPLVAIGGINEGNIQDVIKSGVNGAAMISAITQADDPVKATRSLLNKVA